MVDYFEWLDSYSVGVEQIDADHKQLFGMLNRVVHVVGDRQDLDAAHAILDELLDYTIYHFNHEEILLKRAGYPGFEEHRAIHDRLVRKLVVFTRDFRQQSLEAVDVANFLINWLLKNVLQQDAQFAPHFREHGIR
jgi:hemerythrin-like metal-binding protein